MCVYCGGFLLAVPQWSGRWHRLDCDRCGRTDLRAAEIRLVAPPAAAAEPPAAAEGEGGGVPENRSHNRHNRSAGGLSPQEDTMAQGNYFRQTSEGTVEVQLTQSERDRVCQVLGEAVDVLQTFWRSQDIRGVPLVLLLAGLRCLLWEGMLAGLSAADQALLPTLEAQLLAQGRGGMAEEAVCQP